MSVSGAFSPPERESLGSLLTIIENNYGAIAILT